MKRTIVLGDDDAPVRLMLARVLRAAGYEVLLAVSAADAVAVVQTASPDLVLLDLRASEPEAWENFARIRQLDPKVPLIATTAWSNQEEQAVQRGVDALMEKPFDLPLLLQLISRLLAESNEERKERRQRQVLELSRAAA